MLKSKGVPTLYHYPTTTEFAPNKTSYRIMTLLHGYFCATKKSWAHISQSWLRDRLEEWEKQTVPSSTLNYNLRILEKHGFIERQKRHKRDHVTGQIIFRPSMYKITSKLRRFFNRIADKFQRCGWSPMFQRLKRLVNPPVVGSCTTREKVDEEYRSQSLARQKLKQKGTAS